MQCLKRMIVGLGRLFICTVFIQCDSSLDSVHALTNLTCLMSVQLGTQWPGGLSEGPLREGLLNRPRVGAGWGFSTPGAKKIRVWDSEGMVYPTST